MTPENLHELELDTLHGLYASASGKLKAALLAGAPWDSIQEYRHEVTELEIALYRKMQHGRLGPADAAPRIG